VLVDQKVPGIATVDVCFVGNPMVWDTGMVQESWVSGRPTGQRRVDVDQVGVDVNKNCFDCGILTDLSQKTWSTVFFSGLNLVGLEKNGRVAYLSHFNPNLQFWTEKYWEISVTSPKTGIKPKRRLTLSDLELIWATDWVYYLDRCLVES